jgi:hypothetical protein
MGVFYHLIDEVTGMFAQVVFCRSQDALMVILGMGAIICILLNLPSFEISQFFPLNHME